MQRDGLVAARIGGSVYHVIADACRVDIGFGSRHKESYAQELIKTRKYPQTVVAGIATDTWIELMFANKNHDL